MKRRGLAVLSLIILLVALLLTGCGGGGDDDTSDNGQEGDNGGITPSVEVTLGPPTVTPFPTNTPVPPAPRQKDVPQGEAYDFELPPSVGEFFRITQRGKAPLTQAGGLQATYRRDSDQEVVVVNVYYFEKLPDAGATVEFTLTRSSIVGMDVDLFQSPAVTYGIGQTRQNGHIAAWSNYNWAFVISTSAADIDVLNAFIDPFPY